jgi:hypothetical protein
MMLEKDKDGLMKEGLKQLLMDSGMVYHPEFDRILWQGSVLSCLEKLILNVGREVSTDILHPEFGSFWESEECKQYTNTILENAALSCERRGKAIMLDVDEGQEFATVVRACKV